MLVLHLSTDSLLSIEKIDKTYFFTQPLAHCQTFTTFASVTNTSIMKKIHLSIATVLLTCTMAACSGDAVLSHTQQMSEDQIRASLQFMPFSYETSETKTAGKEMRQNHDDFDSPGLTFTIGRPSRRCAGFGICEVLKREPFKPVFPTRSNQPLPVSASQIEENTGHLATNIKKTNDGVFHSVLLLAKSPSIHIPLESLDLQVEELLVVSTQYGELFLLPGTIKFSPTLGKFGGYDIVFSTTSTQQK